MRSMLAAVLLLVLCGPARAAEPADDAWFAPSRTVAEYRPKGPTHCFRQFNIDWSWVARSADQIPEFLSQADPAAFAEFCDKIHADGTIVMAVPHHGYCTHQTRLGTRFPGMKGDWFGRTIEELHRRKIAAFGYVTLNWNWKFMRDNLGKDFVRGRMQPDGSFDRGLICLNAPGYLELVQGYTREVLQQYPVDGMRWDILSTPRDCTCAGCKAYYRELYGAELHDWRNIDARRQGDFYLATIRRAVQGLAETCRRVKPAVEIWQNSIQSYLPNDLNLGRLMDIAYNEYGDPFRLLFLKGVLNKEAAINGLMNQVPSDPPQPLERAAFRRCLALGGRAYSYYGHLQTDHRTLLPGAKMTAWHQEQLAPFYDMAREIQPYLEGAAPVSPIGVVYCENTRFRWPDYDRKPYLQPVEKLTNAYLQRSMPLEFINSLDLGDPDNNIGVFRVLVLPQTSGLSGRALDALGDYVRAGGNLVVAGDALRHDGQGSVQAEFAMCETLGLHFVRSVRSEQALHGTGHWQGTGDWQGTPPPADAAIQSYLEVRTVAGETPWWIDDRGKRVPLLHLNHWGKGCVAYLATVDSIELMAAVIDRLAGPPPMTVMPGTKQAILTRQANAGRWIIHLMDDGDYTITLEWGHGPAIHVIYRYPRSGWEYEMEPIPAGLRIRVRGAAQDRLLVLQ
jgi:hypothetical protein